MRSSSNPIAAAPARPRPARTWALEDLDEPEAAVPPPGPSAEDQQRDREEKAYRRGFSEGLVEGASRESRRVQPALDALSAALERIEAHKPTWLRDTKHSLYALATAIARQIVGSELATEEENVRALVTRAVAQFPIDEPLTIRLNPLDLSLISAHSLEDPITDSIAAGREVRWRPDPQVGQGGCVVEGPERLVDGRVDKALLRIYHELVDHD